MRDTEIVASIKAGDPIGLAMAYDRYADPLFKYCASLLGDPADAADAVQDTFVVAASRLEGLREPERFRPWLYAVARNESLGILRSKKRTSALAEAPDVTDGSADVSERAERAELRALFEDAAAGLNPGDREVIELQLRQGLEVGEVASVLGVSRNHVHVLLSRARNQLEACLGVLLVARAAGSAGRDDECGELGVMLADWDGRLTVLLRKRVHRHIEHCAACTAKRAFELRPAQLLDLSPGAAMAAGAAESLRLAFGAPLGLKSHTVALATGHGPAAAAHSTAVLSRTSAFGRHGFPKPTPAGLVNHGTGPHGVVGGVKALRSSPRRQAAVTAAVAVAVAVAAVAYALTGHDEHVTQSANPKPPATGLPAAGPPPAATAPKSVSVKPSTAAPTKRSPTTRSPTTGPPTTRTPLTGSPAAHPAPTSAPPASASPTPPRPRPAPTTARATPTARPSPTRASATPSPSPTPTKSSPKPPPPSPPAPPPPPPAPPTLSVLPGGGTMIVIPGSTGSLVSLHASGGTVAWSVSVANDPDHVVSVSPAASGTLTPAHPDTTLTIRTSQFLRCGAGTGTACPAIAVSPGGARLAVWTGWSHPFSSGGGRAPSAAPTGPPPSGATRRITVRR